MQIKMHGIDTSDSLWRDIKQVARDNGFNEEYFLCAVTNNDRCFTSGTNIYFQDIPGAVSDYKQSIRGINIVA